MDYSKVKTKETIETTIQSLKNNGIEAMYARTGEEAAQKALELIPEGAEVMTMTSVTLDEIGLSKELNESGKYDAVKPKLYAMDRATQGKEMNRLGSAPQYSVGSVHAVTEDGKIVVASNSGSQLPGYAYGSQKVVLIVGAQKIVKNMDEALERINTHVLPLESERAKRAYGVPGSFVSKLLVFNREMPGRISMIIVDEALGY
jgi:L-lactate utilization protein LutC